VPFERESLGAGFGVPDLRRTVPTRGDDPCSVGAERGGGDGESVPLSVRASVPALAFHTFAVLS